MYSQRPSSLYFFVYLNIYEFKEEMLGYKIWHGIPESKCIVSSFVPPEIYRHMTETMF